MVRRRSPLRILALTALALTGCESPTPRGDGSIDAALDARSVALEDDAFTTASRDAYAPSPDAARADLVPVSHEREMRGVWVSYLDFPSRTGLSPAQARAELDTIVSRVSAAGLNAIFFHVRPESDAYYRSEIEPWSRFLTGTQGNDPGYDPLEELIERAHHAGIEVHAWFNPFRGLMSASVTAAPNHITRTLSGAAIRYGAATIMDPASAAVRAQLLRVIGDVTDRYDVDGVHFDDYFYPYPDSERPPTPFPDDASYRAYQMSGGTLGLGDWRRENVNTFVRAVHDQLERDHPEIRYGISPFGIYRPGNPPGIVGLDAYASIYCDSRRWMQEDWLDYVAPQLYWPRSPAGQAFGPLATWWGEQADEHEHVYAGQALHRLGTTAAWTLDEYEAQIGILRDLAPEGRVVGSIHFRYGMLASDLLGSATAFADRIYATPALAPAIPRLTGSGPTPPAVHAEAGAIVVTHDAPSSVRFFALYREAGGSFRFERAVGADVTRLGVSSGTWAVSAVGRGGLESLGARVVVD